MRISTVFIFLLLLVPLTSASLFNPGDIKFHLNQTDYYFKVGENAIIPLKTENSYGKQINGMLTYSYSQQINQGGMQMSSSNSQSVSFPVEKGDATKGLNFGTSNNPTILTFSLKFNYNEKEERSVTISNIKIHFVSDNSQKNNQQNQQTASSQKESSVQQQQQQQSATSQMQKQISQMMQQNQQPKESTEQKIQNNQMGQDSSAIKKQMEQQAQEQKQRNQEFQKQLSKNQKFQQEHQKLLQQGYNLTSVNLDATSNSSGNFDLQYKNQKGGTAEMKGKMENGNIQKIQELTQEDKDNLIQKLEKNRDFKKFNNDLEKNGFQKNDTKFSLEENKTKIKVNYKDSQNKTATISADVINNTIQKVNLEKPEKDNSNDYFLIIFLLILALCIIAGYLFYNKYLKKITKMEKSKENQVVEKIEFDYKKESKKLLNQAKKLFGEQRFKDAYEKAGQSLRIYLSYKNGLKKETTNDEIIRYMKNKNKDIGRIKECFDLCSMVEFAKYKPNKKDFNKIVEITQQMIL